MSACAPCVFGAVSSSLLSFPIPVGTVDVQVIPHVTIAGNGSAVTSYDTTTIAAATATATGPVSTITYTNAADITWTTLGATLTWPTIYVDYLAFAGAAATTGCASSLSPSVLTLPAGAPSASLIYPSDNTGALPTGLISYLDGAGGFPAQLNGDQLSQCTNLPNALPVIASISSVITAVIGQTTFPTTVSTDIPPPTTFTSSVTSSFTSLETVPATAAVTQTSGALFNTVTGGPVVYSGGVSTSLKTALGQSLGMSASKSLSSVLSSLSSSSSSAKASSASSSSSAASSSSSSVASVKSSLASVKSVLAASSSLSTQTQPSSRGPTASTGKASSSVVPSASKTSGPALYTGAATRLPAISNSIIADVFGLVALVLYL